jgi:transcriptional regulator of acetoin/glycerol metabolism
LERKHGNVKEASMALGIDRSTLYDKLKRYEISH